MTARKTEMHDLQELIRLHRLGHSRRKIAARLRMSRKTISRYVDAFIAAELLDGDPDQLPDTSELRATVDRHVEFRAKVDPNSSVDQWAGDITRLRTRGAGPTAIHDWLRSNKPKYDGSLSAVKRWCRRRDRDKGPSAADVAIPVQTQAGEVAQVDFGYAGKIYDPDRGIRRKCWVFVMTLGFSRHQYADLVFDQKAATWVRLHVSAFEHFGAVPRVIVPDNLKAAVVRSAFGAGDGIELNRTYREVARHYGFQVDPTPPRSPEKKGKVEAGVRYVKNNFLATWESIDIKQDRRALHRWVNEIAGTRCHGTTRHKPLEVFSTIEQAALLPLPAKRWEPIAWKQATVHRDSHVQIDGAFYSAPWHLLGRRLWVRTTRHVVVIYHNDQVLWSHPRVGRGRRSTIDEHLPEGRRDWRHRSRGHWLGRARAIGPEVEQLAQAIFDADDVLLQLRKVQAVVSHLETFPPQRACAAARRALFFNCLDYAGIKSILRKGLDLEPLLQDQPTRAWSQGSRFARTPTN